jgi:glycosyltransferase involved in cell wall biosynthesis
VIHHGVPTGSFSLQPQHLLQRASEEPYRILYSGRIVAEKGVTTLVRALAKLRAVPGLAGTRLTLLGPVLGQQYEAQLEVLIADLGLGGAIEFLPHCPRREVPEVFRKHDVLAFPSEWPEPFSITLLEAMATGLPVVSTVRGGSVEVLRDGENGVVFRAGDALDLAEKLAWALTHPQETAAIGRAASAEIQRGFTLDAQVRALEGYLEQFRPPGAQAMGSSTVVQRISSAPR